MTAWTEAQKVQIRKYLGFPALFHQQEPRLENAINSVQAVADGGVLPTNDTQLDIINTLAALANVELLLNDTQTYGEALVIDAEGNKAGGVHVDYIRKGFYLRMEGRRLVARLAVPLGTKPFRDVFSALPLNDDAFSPFPTDLA